ncbi:MAG: sulfur globule family protein [Clostridia bacterium]|nr:sulfur globule family protein [Clostridia bacterium]
MVTFLIEGMNGFEMIMEISHGGIIASVVISLLIMLAFYALRSIGIFVLAKRQNVKHAFLAFIPCVWMYTACKIIGNLKTFGSTFAKLAWVFACIFAVAEILTLVYNVLAYYPLVGNLLIGNKNVYYVDNVEKFLTSNLGYYEYWTGDGFVYDNTFIWPYSPKAEAVILKLTSVTTWLSLVFDIASIFVTVHVYIALFRKFWPQHYILATVLSFLGLFAPFVFVIRKKEAIKYSDYLRSRYNAYYGPYGNPYGRPPHGNPYGNPYGNAYGGQDTQPEHPFAEFAERGEVNPGDPFEEFSEKGKKDDKTDKKDE